MSIARTVLEIFKGGSSLGSGHPVVSSSEEPTSGAGDEPVLLQDRLSPQEGTGRPPGKLTGPTRLSNKVVRAGLDCQRFSMGWQFIVNIAIVSDLCSIPQRNRGTDVLADAPLLTTF